MTVATRGMRGPGVAEVSFSQARRPEEATLVRLESFDGPLALLLSLIEQQRLDVLTVRLGDLCAAYLDAVARIDTGRLPLLSAFVSVCSQLILIKSRALLPRAPAAGPTPAEDGYDPEEELRERLLLYRRYRDAARQLADRLGRAEALFHREPGTAAAAGVAGARPPDEPPLDPQLLVAALSASIRLVIPEPAPSDVLPRSVTLEERAAVIRHALRRAPQLVLQELLRDVTDRVVVAVTFLALLELVKSRELVIEQHEPWGPIHVRGQTRAQAEGGRVSDAD